MSLSVNFIIYCHLTIFFPRSPLGLSRCPRAQSSMWTGVWDRVGEGCIGYRFDFIGHGLPTLQPQTILYTLPPSRLDFEDPSLQASFVEILFLREPMSLR